MLPARTVFFGSGPFAVAVLDAVVAAPELGLVGIVTPPARPVGRRHEILATPVGTRAADLGVPVLAPDRLRDPAFLDALAQLDPAIGVLADYGKLVPPAILDRPRHGILNLHPSLLPRHRGATPIAGALLAGDRRTGVSLFRMDPGMDTGPLVAVEPIEIEDGEDAPHLEGRLARVAGALLGRAIGPYLRRELVPAPQPEVGVTVTRPLRREDGRLDPAASALELERRVRALRPWPGTYVELAEGRLAILDAEVADGHPADIPGTLVADGSGLALATAAGRLRLLVLRPAGGSPMDAAAFRRGRPAVAGARIR